MGKIAGAIYTLTLIAVAFLLIRHSDVITGAVGTVVGAVRAVVGLGGK
jgi:hypothetical protein